MEIPGLELLFSSISSSLTNKLDSLVALVHWLIVKENAKCLQDSEGSKLGELLPPGWNADPNEYTLRYVANGKRYVLKVIRVDQTALLHFMEEDSDRLAVLNINIDDVISSEYSQFDRAFVDLELFHGKFKSEIGPIVTVPSGTSSQQSSQRHDPLRADPLRADPLRADPLRADPLRADPLRADPLRADPYRDFRPGVDPFNVGVGDLDPLRAGRGGGGMIFDPFRGGSRGGFRGGIRPGAGGSFLPPGSVPPGARFDPFGPDIEDDRRNPFRSGPRPDHMRPPDFEDPFM